MSQTSDKSFFRTMGGVAGALVLFTFIAIFSANLLAPESGEINAAAADRQTTRVAPVGQLRTALSAADTAAAAAPAIAVKATPEDLVNQACAACHASGVAGAPKIGDTDEWGKRAEAGLDALLASVVNGKGAMPPRGGSALSDDELRSAVEFLVGQ